MGKSIARWGLGLIAVLAFLSHGILDKLSNVTYHSGPIQIFTASFG